MTVAKANVSTPHGPIPEDDSRYANDTTPTRPSRPRCLSLLRTSSPPTPPTPPTTQTPTPTPSPSSTAKVHCLGNFRRRGEQQHRRRRRHHSDLDRRQLAPMASLTADPIPQATQNQIGFRAGGSRPTSTQSSPTHFFCTGFGPFHRVPINPTEQLMRALPSSIRTDTALAESAILASASVINVAAESVRVELDKLYARFSDFAPATRRVLLHFGVNSGARSFQLESMARNEATFTFPDERGFSPILQPIDPTYGEISRTRHTLLPLESMATTLRKSGYDVGVSRDAGRFVCNWLYFHSLARAAKHDAVALFVHVPPVSVASIELQTRFAKDLMRCIASLPIVHQC